MGVIAAQAAWFLFVVFSLMSPTAPGDGSSDERSATGIRSSGRSSSLTRSDRSKWRGGGRRGHGNKRSPGLTRRDGHDAPANSSSAGGGKANTHGARRGAHSSLAGTEEAQAHDADYFLPTYGPLLPEGLLVAAPSSVRAVGGSSAPTAPPSQALAEVVAVTSTDAGTVLSQGQPTQGAVTGLLNRRPPLRMNDAVQRMVRVAGKLGPNNPEHSHFHRGREGQAKANEVERRHTSDVLLGEVG